MRDWRPPVVLLCTSWQSLSLPSTVDECRMSLSRPGLSLSPGLFSALWEQPLFPLHIITKNWHVLLTLGMYSVVEYAHLCLLCSVFCFFAVMLFTLCKKKFFCLKVFLCVCVYTACAFFSLRKLLKLGQLGTHKVRVQACPRNSPEGHCCRAKLALVVCLLWLQLPIFVFCILSINGFDKL